MVRHCSGTSGADSAFFEHYKDLEPGKWVKVIGWEGPESARKDILDAVAAYKKSMPSPQA